MSHKYYYQTIREMKKTLLLSVAFAAVMGVQSVQAQSDQKNNYRTMPKEQLETIANNAQTNYQNLKDQVSDARTQMRDAKKAYTEAGRNYKELTKQMNIYKKQLKDAQKALKLRAKLNKLSM